MTCLADRYETGAEIARQGGRRVLSGRDRRFDREVVLRVLEGPAEAPAEEALLEEARLAAGLEHPGVAPVLDLGRDREGRPFYALRRLRGRTVSDILRETAGDAAARRALLPVFERLCECIAYMHTQGVAHRALSPEGVLVGEFGEVEVTDLGRAGRGEGRDLDVQALGRILEAILGPEPADAGLARIARRCLSADPAERPGDGGAVAAAVSTHLSDARERTRRAEVRAVEERAEAALLCSLADEARALAAASRRFRRRAMALAAALLLLLLTGITGALWFEDGRQRDAARAREAVEAALREAERRAAAGELPAALRAAERAVRHARDPLVPRDLLLDTAGRRDMLAAEVEARRRAEESARRAAEKRRRDEEARLRREWGPPETGSSRSSLEDAAWANLADPFAHLAVARHGLFVEPRSPPLALRHLTALVALRPESAAAWAHLGDAAAAAGRAVEAEAAFARARGLDSEFMRGR